MQQKGVKQQREISELHKRALEQHQWDVEHHQYQWTPEELNMDDTEFPISKTGKGLSPTMDTKDSANVPRSSHIDSTQSASDSSSFFADISAINKSRAKSRTEEEKKKFISAITSQLPSLLQQLVSADMSKTSADAHLSKFMKFLKEKKVSDSLQDVAETAISKLLESGGKEKISLKEDFGPHLRQILASHPAGQLTSPIGVNGKPKTPEVSDLTSSTGQELCDQRFREFLDFLEEKKIFVALQKVVDEAVHRLITAMKEVEEAPP
ncbi:uncharacterized protein LOC115073233 [Rhinatrema bivittatum]|uniref:uncharacterized protein LOC115073233 n=1 Tax=Rhinatrema bivittatum TaxID=194408 RepID=UPI00112E69E7|nr:uncharacterized protein LOC115073233 [Rhinatrema bivittatum]